jgi:hypothetical protein
MKPAAARLMVCVILFAAWMGWLAYLAATAAQPIVLSRPQFLVSTLDVIAEVDQIEPGSEITVREVHWPDADRAKLQDKRIKVVNLADCTGWNGPGLYILPLMRSGKEAYQVAPQPPSPGFSGERGAQRDLEKGPRIYPASPEARRQLNAIPKPAAG